MYKMRRTGRAPSTAAGPASERTNQMKICRKCNQPIGELAYCTTPLGTGYVHLVCPERSAQPMTASSDGLAAPSGEHELAASPLAAPKSDSGQVYRKQIRRLQEQNKLLAECLADERGRRKRAYDWYQNRLHSRLWTIFDMTMMGLRRWPDAGPARASERGAANDRDELPRTPNR